tara:strand:- start:1888 stop:2253 length:366 start_codon:yes stop_codon:yes gene_type:complete
MDFKSKFTLEARKAEAVKIMGKHPDRIPVICEKSAQCSVQIPDIDKIKFLTPKDMVFGQFVYVVRKRIYIKPSQAIFLFINNTTLPHSSDTMTSVYEKYADPDGFLYCKYSGENTFGENHA